jgi:hypothetical protein
MANRPKQNRDSQDEDQEDPQNRSGPPSRQDPPQRKEGGQNERSQGSREPREDNQQR